ERAKETASVVGERAKDAANVVGETTQHAAQAVAHKTGEVATEVGRKGRRARTGLRSFILGIVAGLLTTPATGEQVRRDLRQKLETNLNRVLG
ncbi:MAG TPA: hypothetical protein DEF47_11720, partial [Herpetosiphon sp.]